MKDKKIIWVIVLVLALIIDDSQISQAGTMSATLSSDYQFFYDLSTENNTVLKDKYSIKFFLNGGVTDSFHPESYTVANLPYILPIPKKSGYNFAGWYTESSYRNKVVLIEDIRYGDVTLYAKWTKIIDAQYNVQMYSYTTTSMLSGTDKELKDCNYSFVDDLDIPGMPSTRESDYINNLISTEGQCPQGICITNEYYLITAYCTDDNDSLGSLYVFDKVDGEYLVTLGMKKDSHLGGLAFDGTNVWICHSDSKTLECIPYSYILKIAKQKPQAAVDATGIFKEYKVANVPSCITYFDGKLWVATHNIYLKSVMISYKYLGGILKEENRYSIPDKVQGIAFDQTGNIYLSTSFGRTKSSYLKIYDNVDALNQTPNKPKMKVEMPPCSEEITIASGKVYVLFESASEKYFEGTDGNGSSISPIDKVVTIETASIF